MWLVHICRSGSVFEGCRKLRAKNFDGVKSSPAPLFLSFCLSVASGLSVVCGVHAAEDSNTPHHQKQAVRGGGCTRAFLLSFSLVFRSETIESRTDQKGENRPYEPNPVRECELSRFVDLIQVFEGSEKLHAKNFDGGKRPAAIDFRRWEILCVPGLTTPASNSPAITQSVASCT